MAFRQDIQDPLERVTNIWEALRRNNIDAHVGLLSKTSGKQPNSIAYLQLVYLMVFLDLSLERGSIVVFRGVTRETC